MSRRTSAENWKCGYQNEISVVFCDQNLISIHPMVVHYQDEEGVLQHISFVGLTEEGKHSAPTIYTFMKSFIPKLQEHLPNLKVLHYITDSPSSQYRNKTIAAILARHVSLFGIRASWTYLESGHGKGPCDGVGGGIKKMADNAIKKGETITNVDEFHQVIGEKESKMKLIRVSSRDIQETRDELNTWDIITCDGIGSAHALWSVRGSMMIRETSCFQDCCYSVGENFHPSCQGWQRTSVKVAEVPDQQSTNACMAVVSDRPTSSQTRSAGHQQPRSTTTISDNDQTDDSDDDVPLSTFSKLKKDNVDGDEKGGNEEDENDGDKEDEEDSGHLHYGIHRRSPIETTGRNIQNTW